MLACLGGALVAHDASRRALSGAAYGFMLAAKQSMLFLGGLWLILERRPRHLAVGVIVAIAVISITSQRRE